MEITLQDGKYLVTVRFEPNDHYSVNSLSQHAKQLLVWLKGKQEV